MARPRTYNRKWVERTGIPFIREVTEKLRQAIIAEPLDKGYITRHFTKSALCAHLKMNADTFWELERREPKFSEAVKEWVQVAATAYDALFHDESYKKNPGIYIFCRSNFGRIGNWRRQDEVVIQQKDRTNLKTWADSYEGSD